MGLSSLSKTSVGRMRALDGSGALIGQEERIAAKGDANPTASGVAEFSPVRMAGAVGFNTLDHLGMTVEDALSLTVEIS
jgi:hypothetical protein